VEYGLGFAGYVNQTNEGFPVYYTSAFPTATSYLPGPYVAGIDMISLDVSSVQGVTRVSVFVVYRIIGRRFSEQELYDLKG